MSIRKRLPQGESRRAALEAARALLLESGPQSVTLKAVAARIGRTHGNLLHHFGSAGELQKALAEFLAETVCAAIGEAVRAARAGIGSPREVVELTFEAFGREGGGALAGWMLMTGNEQALDPIVDAIRRLVDDLRPEETVPGAARTIHVVTVALVLMALGDALIGERLAGSLGVPASSARDQAEALLCRAIEQAAGATAGR